MLKTVAFASMVASAIAATSFPPTNCTSRSASAPADLPSAYPTAKGTYGCSSIVYIDAGETFDGQGYRFDRGEGFRPSDCDSQEAGNDEHLFELADGATLKNVIVGREVNDAVYCMGACTLQNVWWEEICEDAFTMKGTHDKTATITKGGARGGTDKCFQHNSGGTMKISDFDFWFALRNKGKFYRSCGGCGWYTRHVEADDIRIHASPSGTGFIAINSFNGDTAKITNIQYDADSFDSDLWFNKTCIRYQSKSDNGKTRGPDSESCNYTRDDISFIDLP